MKFTEWCETVPDEIRLDRVWRIKVYQLAMFAAEKGRHILDADVVTHRLRLYSEIVRLLLTMIPDQRGTTLSEPKPVYEVDPKYLLDDVPVS